MPEPKAPSPDLEGFLAALDMSRKLVALAREQRDALERGSDSQFSWLVLRRQEITDQLPRRVPPGTVPPEDIGRQIQVLQQELSQLDNEMRSIVNERMTRLRDAQASLRRTQRALGTYRQKAGPRAAFIDQKS